MKNLFANKLGNVSVLDGSFTQAHLCHAPFCNVSRDNWAIPIKQARESLAILALQVSQDMESLAVGPLSPRDLFRTLSGVCKTFMWLKNLSASYSGSDLQLVSAMCLHSGNACSDNFSEMHAAIL